jgi:hypothetical protein
MKCFVFVSEPSGLRLENVYGVEREADCPTDWVEREGGAFGFQIPVSQPSDIPDVDKLIEMTGVDASTVAYVTSWGFGVVIFFWSLGYGIGAVLKLIRKI